MDTPASGTAQRTTGTQTEFARARGWSKGYVSKLMSQGRLVLTAAGEVDFDASLRRIRETTGAPGRADAAVQGIAFASAQERERHYSAELKRLELERELGQLRDAADVANAVDDAGAVVRTTVEAWRSRWPPQLAAMGADEARIGAFLAAECEDLLRRMAERFSALALAPSEAA